MLLRWDGSQDAYEPTLGKVHNFVVKKMFQAGVGMVPYRHDFLLKLGPDEACHLRTFRVVLSLC